MEGRTIARRRARRSGNDLSRDFDDKGSRAEARALRTQALAPWIIVAVFLTVAATMFAAAVFSGIGAWRTSSREASAPATVVSFVSYSDDADQVAYDPVVEFYLPDETRQVARVTEADAIPAYEIEQAVSIVYDTQQPWRVRITHGESPLLIWIVPSITGIIAAGFVAATLLAVWLLKSEMGGAR